jgi:hypothetical protein
MAKESLQKCSQRAERWAIVFAWAFGLILTGLAVEQLREITSPFISTTLVVLSCLFATSALIALYFYN